MKTVPLHGKIAAGRAARVDDQDFDLVARYRWFASERAKPAGPPLTYAVGWPLDGLRRTPVYMHRLIAGYPRVEHADNNGLNNQRSNLREASQSQNNANARQRSDNTSGFKGVCWSAGHDAWRAYIVKAGRQYHLGYFARKEDAARAYDAAAAALYAEFARPNAASQSEV